MHSDPSEAQRQNATAGVFAVLFVGGFGTFFFPAIGAIGWSAWLALLVVAAVVTYHVALRWPLR